MLSGEKEALRRERVLELHKEGGRITLKRELSALDQFVLDFVPLLEKAGIEYVVVSGYVAIVFGRSRGTEDVDVLIRRPSAAEFHKLWELLEPGFECHNAETAEKALHEYLEAGLALRFSKKGEFIPNMEVKNAAHTLHQYALDNRLELLLNGRKVFISPLELQVAYKLYLGSEKDLEDARFLYQLFKGHLNEKTLHEAAVGLKVEGRLAWLKRRSPK